MSKKRMFVCIALLLAAISLSACGQKGPLYLPSATAAVAFR